MYVLQKISYTHTHTQRVQKRERGGADGTRASLSLHSLGIEGVCIVIAQGTGQAETAGRGCLGALVLAQGAC